MHKVGLEMKPLKHKLDLEIVAPGPYELIPDDLPFEERVRFVEVIDNWVDIARRDGLRFQALRDGMLRSPKSNARKKVD